MSRKSPINRNIAMATFAGLSTVSLLFSNDSAGYPAPNPQSIPDVDQIYPCPIPDVEAVYPKSSVVWQDSTILTIGDSFQSQRLFSTMLRHLMPKGANVYIETRYGEEVSSWLSTNRLKRMVRKHRPDNVAFSFDISEALSEKPVQLEKQIKNLVGEVHPLTCYWFGPMTQLTSAQDEALAKWVSPCTYISPRVMDPQLPRRDNQGFSKSDMDKWAEKMWHSWYQAFR